jgi:hypothetical protein
MGVQMVCEVANKTSDQAGGSTTTATVLAHAIVKEGAKSVVVFAEAGLILTPRPRASPPTSRVMPRWSWLMNCRAGQSCPGWPLLPCESTRAACGHSQHPLAAGHEKRTSGVP